MLLDFGETQGLHWRYASGAALLLTLLIRDDYK